MLHRLDSGKGRANPSDRLTAEALRRGLMQGGEATVPIRPRGTSYYEVPPEQAAAKLRDLLSFRGLRVPEKSVLRTCLDTLAERLVDLVDAYLAAVRRPSAQKGVHSFDAGLRKLGVELLPVD